MRRKPGTPKPTADRVVRDIRRKTRKRHSVEEKIRVVLSGHLWMPTMSNEIEIRQAVREDVEAIRTLTREAYVKWVPLIGREPLPMSTDYDEALKKHRFDLLFLEGELAALIETISLDDHLLIVNVAVSPSDQGKGLGRKLLDHAEHLAASLGYEEIKLYTNKLFAENLTFYGKLGYQVEREEDFMGGICVHMNKAI